MRQLILTAALAAAAAALGCDDNPFSPSNIEDRTWRLISVKLPGEDLILVEETEDYTIEFEDDGDLDIAFDCNSCSATYDIDDDDIEIDDVSCTNSVCGIDSLDPDIAKALEEVENISLDEDDDELTLSGNGVRMVFEE